VLKRKWSSCVNFCVAKTDLHLFHIRKSAEFPKALTLVLIKPFRRSGNNEGRCCQPIHWGSGGRRTRIFYSVAWQSSSRSSLKNLQVYAQFDRMAMMTIVMRSSSVKGLTTAYCTVDPATLGRSREGTGWNFRRRYARRLGR
jgi:hypothetical protein